MVIHIAFIILSLIQTLHVPSTLNEHCCLNLIFHKLIDVLASSSLILECVLPLREDSVEPVKPSLEDLPLNTTTRLSLTPRNTLLSLGTLALK